MILWKGKINNEKDGQDAHMGLPCLFKHRHKKGSGVVDLGLRNRFYLLHSVGTYFRQ